MGSHPKRLGDLTQAKLVFYCEKNRELVRLGDLTQAKLGEFCEKNRDLARPTWRSDPGKVGI